MLHIWEYFFTSSYLGELLQICEHASNNYDYSGVVKALVNDQEKILQTCKQLKPLLGLKPIPAAFSQVVLLFFGLVLHFYVGVSLCAWNVSPTSRIL